jgi:hypothetical protein
VCLSPVPEGTVGVELPEYSFESDLEARKEVKAVFPSIDREYVRSESPELVELLLLNFRSEVLACLCFSCSFLNASAWRALGSSTLSADLRKSLLATPNLFRECNEEEVFKLCVLLSLFGTGGGSLHVGVSGRPFEQQVGKDGVFVKGPSFDDDFDTLTSVEGIFVRHPS